MGRDFLPRGSNIVTRRPLILQLVKTAGAAHTQQPEWGEFLHCPAKRFVDFERIRQEILAETDRVVGTNKGISDQPIRLKIFSPHVLTMTLVDLPGLARVPVGDQPQDIEDRLRRLILQYISAPTCIILAVTPANQDIASSDALDLAREADPEGLRTIGVLTKLDIMDRGTDAVPVLRNEVVPLRLGYVGVVLRSQEDITQRVSMSVARELEHRFFQARTEYSGVAELCGVATLARVLNSVLVDAIADALPALRAKVEDALAVRRRELRLLGDAPPAPTDAARGGLLLSILDGYSGRFAAMLDGHGEHLPISELAGGARIRHIFQEIFTRGLDSLDPTAELSDEDVRTAIKNSGGIKGSLLIPDAPFELLVRRAIERLLAPSLQCKEFVHAELLRIASQCVPPEVGRFPKLQALLTDAVAELVAEGAAPAEQMIRNFVACELGFINTSHPQFIGGNRAIASVLERRAAPRGAGSSGSGDEEEMVVPAHRPLRGRKGDVAPRAHPVTASSSPNGLAVAARFSSAKLEPELFRPEELLRGGGGPSGGHGEVSEADARSRAGWFTGWFARGGEGAMDVTAVDSPPTPALQRPPFTLRVPKTASDQEGVQVEVTRVLVDSYFDIVRKNLQDAVPKALMHFLVNATRRGLQQHLIRALYREELLEELMMEREDIATKRQRCNEALRALRSAIKVLEAAPGEMAGRVNASGARWNFRHILQAVDDAAGQELTARRSSSPLKNGLKSRVHESSRKE